MLRRTLLAAMTRLALGESATIKDRRTSTSYLPKHALQCERAATRPVPNKHCKNCNQRAVVGAADSVTVQIGGCRVSDGSFNWALALPRRSSR